MSYSDYDELLLSRDRCHGNHVSSEVQQLAWRSEREIHESLPEKQIQLWKESLI